MVDIPFTSYAFPTNPAIGATTPRSMPVRLAEVKNVLDFGAFPDGSNPTATRAAIQAAVDWTAGPNRGTIYFPMGTYNVDGPITYNYNGDLSICFRGEIGTHVNAYATGFNGYVFDRALGTPNNTAGGRTFELLGITNPHPTGGCIRMGSTLGGVVRDCGLNGWTGVTTEDSPGVSSKNINIMDCQCVMGGGDPNTSHAIVHGGGGTIQNCGIVGNNIAVVAYGYGLHCSGNRMERNNTGFLLGKDSAGTSRELSGFSIIGMTFEGNWFGIDMAGPCNGFFIGSLHMQGHDRFNSGVGTPSSQGTQCAIRIAADCGKNGVISGCDTSSWTEVAGFSIANATSRTNLVFAGCTASVAGGVGVPWGLPTNAYTVAFVRCNLAPIWTFAQLPSGANVLEGDEFDISDSFITPVGNWGATVSAGGGSTTTNRCRVRWNGTAWTIVGR